MLPMTTLADHIDTLAKELGATLHYDVEMGHGSADPKTLEVHVAPITDEQTYSVALHELGHIADRGPYLAEYNAIAVDVSKALSHAILTTGELPPDRDAQVFQNRLKKMKLKSEIRAWRWARARALAWTPGMDRPVQYGLASYAQQMNRFDRAMDEVYSDAA